MSFTMDDLRREYAVHGDSLFWLYAGGRVELRLSPASLTPDERARREATGSSGEPVIKTVTYRALGYDAEPRRSKA